MSVRYLWRALHVPALLLLILTLSFPPTAAAQATGIIQGRVADAATDEPLPGATVQLRGTTLGTATGPDGTFRLSGVPTGPQTLAVRSVGYEPLVRHVEIPSGEPLELTLALTEQPVDLGGIEVTALRPDLQPRAQLEAAQVREANPRDSGELMRQVPGVGAVRRGPVGLDPAVRGLRETEVGTYLDGTRIFPGGPARMDSPLSHLDPSAIRTIEVVKGPYALTWGAGNMSAVRVETQSLQDLPDHALRGRATTGYDTNFGAYEAALETSGRRGAFAYQLQGAWREGDDYETGGGGVVPADFLSREVRGKLGYRITPASMFTLSAGYQNQGYIDYPGRLLNASHFDVYNLSARWQMERPDRLLRGAEVLAYVNDVGHGMDNEGKPSAEMMSVTVASDVRVTGGRLAATLAPTLYTEVEVGADVYSAFRDAVRHRRMNEMGGMDDMSGTGMNAMTMTDLMWPEATITDAGTFARVTHAFSSLVSASGTLRFDAVYADADTASTFFREQWADDLHATEGHLSGAFTVSLTPSAYWTASVGLGSVVRTADATERYSDRIPASKAQTSAEFVGTPDLAPERSTQADLWLEGAFPRWTVTANAFARRIDDYITLAATDLPSVLMMNQEKTVYRYVNGEATFWGFEAGAAYMLLPALQVKAQTHYLWGRDETLREPALGILPFGGSIGLRYDPDRFFAEATVRAVAEQNRVATARGEVPTDGYATIDLKGGVELMRNVSLQGGITNLLDANYVNHLNAKNPFTSTQIYEPGRVFFVDVTVAF